MPSNLKEFGTTPNNVINKSEAISSIPSYLRKNKQSFNSEITNYEYNADASGVDSVILAMGEGHILKSNNVSYKLGVYSSFVLGRKGYNNRWDASYQDSENFLLSYFDGNSYFKRLSIDYSTGNLKTKNIDLRGGNTPNCNAYSQLAFGTSGESSFEDYSNYRHNFRTSHTGLSELNNENAIDIYLWDATTDTPGELGSRHVMRLNALGNEELIAGFRIDGGLAVAVTTTQDKNTERDTYAIPGKGVLYYNTISNTFRFSNNGGLFKEIGDASASPIVNLPATQIAIGNGSTGLISSASLTFSGGTLVVGGDISANNLTLSTLFNGLVKSVSGTLVQATAADIPGMNVAPNQIAYGASGSGLTSSSNLTYNGTTVSVTGGVSISSGLSAGTATVNSLSAGGIVKSVAGVLAIASASDILGAISFAIGNTQVAVGNGTGIVGYSSFTYTATGGSSILTVGDTSGNVGRVIVKNGLSGGSEHNFGMLWATSTNPIIKIDQGLVGSWEAITFYTSASPKKIQLNANVDVIGELNVSSLGVGTSLVKSVAGVLTNATLADIPGVSVAPNQVAYGSSTSGITSSPNFQFDGTAATINNPGALGSALSVSGGIPARYIVGGSSSYGLGVHLSASALFGPTVELGNGSTNWMISNRVDDIFRISRGPIDCITHTNTLCTIKGIVDVTNLHRHKTYVSVAAEDDHYLLGTDDGYWVIPTGSNSMIIDLPAAPKDLTNFCIFTTSLTSFISRIEGNGKKIVTGWTSGSVDNSYSTYVYGRYSGGPNATILMFDALSDVWYAYKGGMA